MVLVSEKSNPKACIEFEAEVYLLFHAKSISKGFQATIHVGNVCQTASITSMDKENLKTNERAKVTWRFKSRPEFLVVGSRLIFREGSTKGMGEVTGIKPIKETNSSSEELNKEVSPPSAHLRLKSKPRKNPSPVSPIEKKMRKKQAVADDLSKNKPANDDEDALSASLKEN